MKRFSRVIRLKKNVFLLFGFSILMGCDEKKDFRIIIEENTGVEISEKYEELNAETNFATGDYSESVYLKFDSVGFSNIVNQVLISSYYTNTIIEGPQIDNGTPKGAKKWYIKSDGYKFEYNINGFKEFVECYIDTTKRTMYYQHIQE
jgi:hypothetical protein